MQLKCRVLLRFGAQLWGNAEPAFVAGGRPEFFADTDEFGGGKVQSPVAGATHPSLPEPFCHPPRSALPIFHLRATTDRPAAAFSFHFLNDRLLPAFPSSLDQPGRVKFVLDSLP